MTSVGAIEVVLRRQLQVDPARPIHMTDRLIEDLGADSLDFVELASALEAEFDLDIPDAIMADFVTVGDVIRFVQHPTAAPVAAREPAFLRVIKRFAGRA